MIINSARAILKGPLALTRARGMSFLLCLALLTATGFSASVDEDYFPLAVGQERTMAATSVSATGEIFEGLLHRVIEGTVEKSGKTYFRFRTWTDGLPRQIDYLECVRKDEKGYYSIDEKDEAAVEHVDYVLPLKLGASWKRVANSRTTTVTVLAFESIEINGEAYKNCCHLRTTNTATQFTEEIWLAPNLGSIKSLMAFGGAARLSLTLKDFKAGK